MLDTTKALADASAIEAAMAAPTVPPGLDPEKVTVATLIDLVVAAKKLEDPRDFKSRAKAYCVRRGLGLNDLAKRVFTSDFDRHRAQLIEDLESSGKASRNILWAADLLHEAFEKLKANPSLPVVFADALAHAMQSRGYTPTRLIRELSARFGCEHHGSIYEYLRGTRHPMGKKGVELVTRIDLVLELAPGSLMTRAFPKAPPMILAPDGRDIGYRTRQSELSTKGRYWIIKTMPPQFEELWRQISWHRSLTSHMTRKKRSIEVQKPWTKAGTEEINRRYLTRFMSYLCLPAPTKLPHQMEQEEHWVTGKGFKPEDLTFAQWFDVELLHEYVQFRKQRTWNGQLTAESCDLVAMIGTLCKYETSYVNKHPELYTLFGHEKRMSEEAWDAWVREHLAESIVEYAKELRQARPKTLARAPEDALRHVLYAKDPMILANQMVHAIKASPVPPVRAQRHAIWLRDIAIVSLLLECPLRARNICELEYGSTIGQRGGVWYLDIPKADLKNHASPDAQAIYSVLSASASEAVQAYMDHRKALDLDDTKRPFFLVQPKNGTRKKSATGGGLTLIALERLVSKWLLKSFGRGSGPHFFRHLIATAILRKDPTAVAAAAAVLNISEEVVRERYAHLLQKDGLDRAKKFLDQQRLEAEVRATMPNNGRGLQ